MHRCFCIRINTLLLQLVIFLFMFLDKSYFYIFGMIDHVCSTPGCRNVIVLDGNMKNARQVCGCKESGELHYRGMNGRIIIGKF